MRHTTDNVLLEYQRRMEEAVRENGSSRSFEEFMNKHRMLTRVKNLTEDDDAPEQIYDSIIYNPYAKTNVLYRVIRFPIAADDGHYIVRFALPTMERSELTLAILISSICFFIIFAGTSLFAMRYMERITHPLQDILDQIRNYDIRNPKQPERIKAQVEELEELSVGLHGMMKRMHHDYGSMKELMENSSHELQTPLSVIRMKLEQLSQLCADSEEQLQYIVEMRSTLQRLSSLNRSILLISRISSDHFYRQEQMNLQNVLQGLTAELEEILEASEIGIEWAHRNTFMVKIHPVLAEILMSNMLSNAVKYNKTGGRILIDCTEHELSIRNTYSNQIPEGNLFDRYICTKDHDQASGLGLPIVKEICNHNDLEVEVDITEEYFTIELHHKAADGQKTT